jgi:glycerophosphoryl diester phosphodiesterase
MVRFTAVVLLAVAALSEARNLKGSKGTKSGKAYKGTKKSNYPVQVGARPYYVVDSMEASPLKEKLTKCAETTETFTKSDWSIGHRGAGLMFPEHTLESYKAALIQGAGIVECDVTFTKDRELICRHDQCDLHTTTDVVTRPEMNAKCTTPWTAGGSAKCCASDFTLAEIKTFCAKMDSAASGAMTAEAYIGGVAGFRTTMYEYECPEVPTHKESIALMMDFGGKFTPELKTPAVTMPYEGDYTQEDYAQQMIDEYIEAGVDPSAVWPQSFLWEDAIYWVQNTDFKQAVALEGNYDAFYFSESEFAAHVADIKDAGVPFFAPPMWMLLELDGTQMVISDYGSFSKDNGFEIITWTLERSGPLKYGGGWYYTSVAAVIDRDGDQYELLNALHEEVGIVGIFSDWPATVTFYANCMGL